MKQDCQNAMKLDDVLRLLAATRVFANLRRDELALFADHIEGVGFVSGDTLVQERQMHEGVHVVLRGSLEVILPSAARSGKTSRSNDITLATLKSGDCFGEYSIFDDKPASASVIGMRDGQLIRIKREAFRTVLGKHDRVAKSIYYNLLRILVERQRAAGKDMDILMSDASRAAG